MLEISGLHVYYGEIHALKGAGLALGRGEIVALLGPNGAGKSTTLRTISGLVPPREGTVTLEGQSLVGVPSHRIVARGVAHVPEGRKIFNRLTVADNLEMGAYIRSDGAVRDDLERVFTTFPRLRERRRQVAGTLSGGEQQMLAIGRALMTRPRVLLLDINRQGTPILLVEQNAAMALEVAQRAYVLETGRVVLEGPAVRLRDDPSVRQAYLGEG
jgi:branched-chain amino acid transport system ATP-binding protein